MVGGMFYFFRSEPGAAELRRLARQESGRVCQRVLMIANLLEGMEPEEAGRLAGSAEPRPMSGITVMRKKASRDCGTGRVRAGSRLWMGRRRCV
jgi:hypothetical protein